MGTAGTARALTGGVRQTRSESTASADLREVDRAELLRGFSRLVTTDRGTTAMMLAYIGEIDRRKLYLEDAYPSMFALCTKHFRMSESIAAKRIRAGRTACRFPCVLGMIRRGELHLSGLHQLASYLTEKNHKEVLHRARHKSMREIDELIAELAPKPDPGTIIQAVAQEALDGGPTASGKSSPPEGSPSYGAERAKVSLGGVHHGGMPANSLRNLTIPLSPRRYRLHVTIGQEARDALEELQNLLSHQIPTGDPAMIVEHALGSLLIKAKKRKAALTRKPQRRRKKSSKKTRAVPAHVRRRVFERDGGKCAFVDRMGRRCNSTWQIELHHLVPYGREGPHSIENVELRCRAHNQYEADIVYGKAFMQKRRKSA